MSHRRIFSYSLPSPHAKGCMLTIEVPNDPGAAYYAAGRWTFQVGNAIVSLADADKPVPQVNVRVYLDGVHPEFLRRLMEYLSGHAPEPAAVAEAVPELPS